MHMTWILIEISIFILFNLRKELVLYPEYVLCINRTSERAKVRRITSWCSNAILWLLACYLIVLPKKKKKVKKNLQLVYEKSILGGGNLITHFCCHCLPLFHLTLIFFPPLVLLFLPQGPTNVSVGGDENA